MTNSDLGQIFTKRIVADYMVSLFTLPSKSLILDPCFGGGVFLDSLTANTDYSVCGYEIDNELFRSYKNKKPGVPVHNSDFLLSDISTKYDGVIMNPPYIRHEKIDVMADYGISKDRLAQMSAFSDLPKSANLYMYFVIKAIDVLKPKGELIVIFPDSWLNSRGGAKFRDILSSHCSVTKKIHVSGTAFEQAPLVDVIILKLNKNTSLLDCEPFYVRIKGNSISQRMIERFPLSSRNKVPFHNYATVRRGLTTGFNAAFVNPQISDGNDLLVDIISSPKSVAGYSTDKAITDKLLVIKHGATVSQELKLYLAEWEKIILETNRPKTLVGKIKNGEKWYSLNDIDCRGIIFGYIVRNEMRFILNERGTTARDNFYVISPSIDAFIMLALLNNYYVYVQLESIGRRYGGGILKLQKYDIESLVLTDLSAFSEEDKKRLSTLGNELAKTGDRQLIDDITLLLSGYEAIDSNKVKSQYEYMRSARLEKTK